MERDPSWARFDSRGGAQLVGTSKASFYNQLAQKASLGIGSGDTGGKPGKIECGGMLR